MTRPWAERFAPPAHTTPPKAASPLELGAVLYFREGSCRRDCDVTEADYDDATERLLLAGGCTGTCSTGRRTCRIARR